MCWTVSSKHNIWCNKNESILSLSSMKRSWNTLKKKVGFQEEVHNTGQNWKQSQSALAVSRFYMIHSWLETFRIHYLPGPQRGVNIDSAIKRAQQRMNFLFRRRNFKLSQELLFQLYTIQSVICTSVTAGFGSATEHDGNRLQWRVTTAERIIGSHLPSILHLNRSHHRSITPWRQPIPTSLLWLALQNTVGQNMQTQEQFFTRAIAVMNSQCQ